MSVLIDDSQKIEKFTAGKKFLNLEQKFKFIYQGHLYYSSISQPSNENIQHFKTILFYSPGSADQN
jgi:hypothetical protein